MAAKKIIAVVLSFVFISILSVAGFLLYVTAKLPKMISLDDYKPLVVSEVYGGKGEKIGEFFREKRIVLPFEQIPKTIVDAFLAAEDANFFQHGGVDYAAILRAAFSNVKEGRIVGGGSTITQQLAKTLLLTNERTMIRKVKEAILSYRIEAHLSKQQILYLYLNQIYLGHGAYGVAAAAENYFRKTVDKLTLGEMAMLAGLPKAPGQDNPIRNPRAAKERQVYVLNRMATVGAITDELAKKTIQEPLIVYLRENYNDKAPYLLETIRQHLVRTLGENAVLDEGIRIFTKLDVEKQSAAQKALRTGLRELDKRQGYRGAKTNISDVQAVAKFLLDTRNQLMDEALPTRTILADGSSLPEKPPLKLDREPGSKNLPEWLSVGTILDGIVTKVDDELGLVTIRFAESQGLIDLETMKWARKPDPNVAWENAQIKKPSEAVKLGDVVQARITGEKFVSPRLNKLLADSKKAKGKKNKGFENLPDLNLFVGLELEQEPLVEGAILTFDVESGDLLTMVGGYDFKRNEFNRALQALRQTGSAFKPIVYAAALDRGFTPATTVVDAPIVYDEGQWDQNQDLNQAEKEKRWKPGNYTQDFSGDVLFRNALIKSLNIPTVKILEDVGVENVGLYARRLGLFSPLNMDLSLGLGSSSVTLYEITRVFGHFARLGKKMTSRFVEKVTTQSGQVLAENITLEQRFENELRKVDEELEEKRKVLTEKFGDLVAQAQQSGDQAPDPKKRPPKLFFNDPDQLIAPETAFVMTNLLQGAVNEGTGARARSIGRTVAGKTGTTNGYFDAWFIGYTPQLVTGVWVGFDTEKTLGRGETGGSAALPIWSEYMKTAVKEQPDTAFSVPPGIVFANIDNESGHLASASSKKVVRQAFFEGTEPKISSDDPDAVDQKEFLKEELAE